MAEVLENAARLSQVIGARPGGTEEEQQASFFIEETMQKAGLVTSIEEFNCNPNYELPRFICCVVSVLLGILAIFLPLMVIPAFIVTLITAALYVLEVVGVSPLGNTAKRGISQNIIARYIPGTDAAIAAGAGGTEDELLDLAADEGARLDGASDSADGNRRSVRGGRSRGQGARKRKIILVARYDSGRVHRELSQPFFGVLPIIHWIEIGGMVLIPVMLLIRMLAGAESPATAVLNVILAIGVVAAFTPILLYILHQTAPYSDGANNNASGVAVMAEVARRIAATKSQSLDALLAQEALAAGAAADGRVIDAAAAGEAAALAVNGGAEGAVGSAVDPNGMSHVVTDENGLVVMHGEDALRNENVLPVDTDLVYEDVARGRMDPSSLEAEEAAAQQLVDHGIVGAQNGDALAGAFVAGGTRAGQVSFAEKAASAEAPAAGSLPMVASVNGATAASIPMQTNVRVQSTTEKRTNVPDWFKKGIEKANARKEQTHKPDNTPIARSRFSDALDAAAATSANAIQEFETREAVKNDPELQAKIALQATASVSAPAAAAAQTSTTTQAAAAAASTSASASTPAAVPPQGRVHVGVDAVFGDVPAAADATFAEVAQAQGVHHEIEAAADQQAAEELQAIAQVAAETADALSVEEEVTPAADMQAALAAATAQQAMDAQAAALAQVTATDQEALTAQAAALAAAQAAEEAQAAAQAAEEAAVADRTISYIPVAADIPTDASSAIEGEASIADSIGKSASDILEEATAKTVEAEAKTRGGKARVVARRKREISLPSLTGALGKVVAAQQDAPLAEDADREVGEQRTALKRKQQEQQSRLASMLPSTDSAPLDQLADRAATTGAMAKSTEKRPSTSSPAQPDPNHPRVLVNPKDDASPRSSIAVASSVEGSTASFIATTAEKDAEAALNSLNFEEMGIEPGSTEPTKKPTKRPAKKAAAPARRTRTERSFEEEKAAVNETIKAIPVPAPSATNQFEAIGDTLIADMVEEDIVIEDVDDSAYAENLTLTGAMAGPGYVEMPKSRASRFKSIFSRKKKAEETSFSEAMGLDKDFDARKVGTERGGWESFQNESADYNAGRIDNDEIIHDSQEWDDWDDDWNGGAFSLRRKNQADNDDAYLSEEEVEFDEYGDFDEYANEGNFGRELIDGRPKRQTRSATGRNAAAREGRPGNPGRPGRDAAGRSSRRSTTARSNRNADGQEPRSSRSASRSSARKAPGPFDSIAGKLSSLTHAGAKDDAPAQRRRTPEADEAFDERMRLAPEDMLNEREEIRRFHATAPADIAGASFSDAAAEGIPSSDAPMGDPHVIAAASPFGDLPLSMPAEDIEVVESELTASAAFPTEVWFVALGAELTDHAGIKSFLAEHDEELSGAIVIELEALGAGTLSQVDEEGIIKRKKAPSRMKRFVTKAGTALGLHINGVKMDWRESSAYFAAEKGLQTIHLAGIKDNKPEYMGEKDDVLENLSEEKMLENAAFVVELLRTI